MGGKNSLPMKELATALEENGYQNVKTYIQSGNVVLQGKAVSPADIAKLVTAEFGFDPDIIILEKSAFLLSIQHNPFQLNEGKSAHFYFCSKKPKLNPEKLEKYLADSEEYKLIDKVFYLHAPNGIGHSKLVANLESCLGVRVTGRNFNTIRKLAQMLKNA